MRRKLIIGVSLFVVGILLQIVSDIADTWIIDALGGILWPAGSLIVVNTSICHKQTKQGNDSYVQSTEIKND